MSPEVCSGPASPLRKARELDWMVFSALPMCMGLVHFSFFLIYLFILIGGQLLYNIVVVSAIHWHESPMGSPCVPHPEPPSHLPPHPIPQYCPSAPTSSALLHAWNLDWSSLSQIVIYMFQCYSLKSFHPHLLPQSPKVCSLHLCSYAALHIGLSLPSL